MDVQELLSRVGQNLSVGRAFGTAYEKDGSLVIPVALVTGGGGAGEGTNGAGGDGSGDEVAVTPASASGGSGGGFGGVVMPVGVYVVKDERVRWIPAVNANLLVIVTFVTLRMILRARFRAQRRAR